MTIAGCTTEDPPPAGPADSPRVSATPAGRVIELGGAPEGVVADPGSGIVAVALRGPDELALVDGRSGALLERVALPGPARHLALDGRDVLVPAAGLLGRLRLPRGELAGIPVAHASHDAVAAGGRVFVTAERRPTVSVVRGGRKVQEIRTAGRPGALAALEDGRTILVVSAADRVLEAFDARSGERIGSIPVGAGPTHLVTDGKNLAYVIDTVGGAVLVVRLRPRLEITRRVHVPGAPHGVAIDRERDHLWVTTTRDNELVQLTADGRPRPLARFPTVQQADTVAVDERTGRVFVTGRGDGTLQLLDAP